MLVGSVTAFAGPLDPENLERLERLGWLPADGRELARDRYQALFAVIGEHWGAGDGRTTFNVPDLRGHFLRGVSGHSGVDAGVAEREPRHPGAAEAPDAFRNQVGSYQADRLRAHVHGVERKPRLGEERYYAFGFPYTSNVALDPADIGDEDGDGAGHGEGAGAGNEETRPINAYVEWLVKVF